jgi:hypothetical protein
MAYDLEEQEQIAVIKNWWQTYGTALLTVLVVIMVSVSAYQWWRYYRVQQSTLAATLYSQLDTADLSNDPKKVIAIASAIVTNHESSHYASMAQLRAAKALVASVDLAGAVTRLQWTVDHAKEDEIRDIARLRLAGVLLDQKKFDESLKLLAVKPLPAFDGLYAELKADVLATQLKKTEAREAYQLALTKLDINSPYRQVLQIKLDTLGEVR